LKRTAEQATGLVGAAPSTVGRDNGASEGRTSDQLQADRAESRQNEQYPVRSFPAESPSWSSEIPSYQIPSNQIPSNQAEPDTAESYGLEPDEVKSRVDEAYAAESVDLGRGHAGSADVLMSAIQSRVPPSRTISLLTAVMGGVICLTAVGLTLRVAQRFGWIDLGSHSRAGATTAQATNSGNNVNQPGAASVAGTSNSVAQTSGQVPAKTASANPAASSRSSASSASSTANGKALPPGSLMVSENGKEVFRMVPVFADSQSDNQPTNTASNTQQGAQSGASASSGKTGVEQAATIEPDRVASEPVVHLSSSAAEEGLLVRVEPDYPEAARQQKIQGAVVLDLRVRPDGTVQQVTLVSGDPLLANAAIAAVNRWQFKPHSVNGQTIAMQTRVTLNFRLSR
jgi:TonB family protein